jgi:hypothetical protein
LFGVIVTVGAIHGEGNLEKAREASLWSGCEITASSGGASS